MVAAAVGGGRVQAPGTIEHGVGEAAAARATERMEECETVPAPTARKTRPVMISAVLLACMVGVALVAAAGVDATARPRPERELLSKADDALQGSNGKVHALAVALQKRNAVLQSRRASVAASAAVATHALAVQRSASKLAMPPKTMTRGKMLDEEPAAEEEPAASAEEEHTTGIKRAGQGEGVMGDDVESEIGNLKPTGIMGVFFSGHTLMIALGIICFLILSICLFARYGDCALT